MNGLSQRQLDNFKTQCSALFWCKEKIYPNDIEYALNSILFNEISQKNSLFYFCSNECKEFFVKKYNLLNQSSKEIS